MTTLCLIRHGTTNWNIAGRLQGQVDVPLSEQGRAEARAVAMRLRNDLWHAIYSSPLRRAADTAESIAAQIGLQVRYCTDLQERAFGVLEGKTHQELRTGYPDWQRRESEIEGLERFEDLKQRATRVLSQIADTHLRERVIVVSHGAFVNAFLAAISEGQVGTGVTRLRNGAITLLEREGESWSILRLNDDAHLSGAGGFSG